MSVRLEVQTEVAAPVPRVWDVLIDWAGQGRWIPVTTVTITTPQREGLGVRAAALSGFRVRGVPVGLLDRFVVTGWRPPERATAELEVLHLGPYFTGEGVFTLQGHERGTTVTCVELISVPGGRAADALVRLALPLLRAGYSRSLRAFAVIAEHQEPAPDPDQHPARDRA